MTNNRVERSYSVSDLVSCKRKKYYKEIGILKEDLNSAKPGQLWSTTRGDFLHEITRAYRWRELDVEYSVILRDGKIVKLIGRLDIYDWKSRTIIDVKTSNFVDWQIKNNYLPRKEHILQIQCYATMFSQLIPVENLSLLYIDMSSLFTFNIKNIDRTEWIKKRIQGIEDSLNTSMLPRGEVSGLCQFCKYQKRCIKDGGGLTRGEGNYLR